MLFDGMCRLIERASANASVPYNSGKVLEQKLRMASLLVVPGRDVVEGKWYETFRMLWPMMAVETDSACVYIQRLGACGEGGPPLDRSKRWGTAAVGLERDDVFGVAIYVEDPDRTRRARECIIEGTCRFAGIDGGQGYWQMLTTVDSMTRNTNGDVSFKSTGRDDSGFGEGRELIIQNLIIAMRKCSEACQPSKWVLREQVARAMVDPRSARKIPRSHQRPRWIVISNAERIRYFRNESEAETDENGEHREVTPHPRRAHYRRIATKEDGTPRHTWVRACWVGSKEAEIRGARYMVELDL